MSRLVFVALLFAFLALSFTSSASAACANSCSSNGQCVGSGNAAWCNCTVGYVGLDCSIKTSMTQTCWVGGQVCSQWGVQDGYLYQRIVAWNSTAAGWVGVMWGATDGMSGGQSTIFHLLSGSAVAFDGYNTKKGKPTNLTDQSVAPANVTGGASLGGIDISFVRQLDTGLSQHFVIPAAKGTSSTMSLAFADSFFEFHGNNAEFIKSIDIVGVASEEESVIEKVAHTVSNRHARLGALKANQ